VSSGQRFAFLVGPPLYLSLTWPAEISLEEASRGQVAADGETLR